MIRGVALFLTVLTGFSGLVYEIAWQKYLAALLGSHSEATAAVLGIFLGGLAYGYSLFGRVTRRLVERAREKGEPASLLLTYGIVEAGIGVWALLFPVLFRAVQSLSLTIPGGVEAFAFSADVLLCALLIGPPTVLMGGTIPILTQALASGLADATRFHAFVYAFNTAGAFVGALAGGFFLIPWLGLDGVVLAMGFVNLGVGILFAVLGRRSSLSVASVEDTGGKPELPNGYYSYATVALLSGFAMMALQTTMNRIGGLSLGPSHFTFAMVVATFVLSIALGSFAVTALPKIRPSYLVISQWALVALLLVLYPHVADAPYWAHRIRTGFGTVSSDFYPYHLRVFLGLLAVFVLPLGLSGATLPLLFHHLRREVGDLGSIAGRLYSWNTVGSLLGALLAGYALLFWLDLHHIYRLAVLTLAVGAAIVTVRVLGKGRVPAAAGLAVVAIWIGLQPQWSQYQLSSGLFQHRVAAWYTDTGADYFFEQFRRFKSVRRIVFYDDDPTTSVAVIRYPDAELGEGVAILTNGKSDGAVPGDNLTMAMASLLPAILAEKAERSFVVGYGTGVTVAELAAVPSMREVVVAEISQGVIDAAPYFEPYTLPAATSEKTKLLRSDAYRALLRSEGGYDVIASEPSHPWVTGVEMLFSAEFLRAGRERLAPGGIFAQWYHVYSTDVATMELVLNTYRQIFDRVALWYAMPNDFLILGFKDGEHDVDLDRLEARWLNEGYAASFARVGIESFGAFLAHEILPMGVLAEADLTEEVHTITHPILSHRAAQAFFVGKTAALPPTFAGEAGTVGASNSLLRRYKDKLGGTMPPKVRSAIIGETCEKQKKLCLALVAEWQQQKPDSKVLRRLVPRLRKHLDKTLSEESLSRARALFDIDSVRTYVKSYEDARDLARTFVKYYHHAAPFRADALREAWQGCAGDPRCDAVLARLGDD